MHLILHLFKKDLRRTHLILAFWLLLVAVQYAIMAASLRPGDRIAQMTYGAIAVIGPVLGMLVLAVLVALLVQEESPAGTTGFWLTRPIAAVSRAPGKGDVCRNTPGCSPPCGSRRLRCGRSDPA